MASKVQNRHALSRRGAESKRARRADSRTRSLRGVPSLGRSPIQDGADIELLHANHWAACRRDPRYRR
jgi:hypothetical protein